MTAPIMPRVQDYGLEEEDLKKVRLDQLKIQIMLVEIMSQHLIYQQIYQGYSLR